MFRQRNQIPANELAEVLFTEFIQNDGAVPMPANFANLVDQEALRGLCGAYRLALVLLVLDDKNGRFTEVAKIVRTVLASNFTDSQFGDVVVQGIENLSYLYQSTDSIEMSWAHAWLEIVGIGNANPVDLALVTKSWMDAFVAIRKTLDALEVS
jgi:hypothetical protein